MKGKFGGGHLSIMTKDTWDQIDVAPSGHKIATDSTAKPSIVLQELGMIRAKGVEIQNRRRALAPNLIQHSYAQEKRRLDDGCKCHAWPLQPLINRLASILDLIASHPCCCERG